MHIFFQNDQYLGSYYFTRSADDPVHKRKWDKHKSHTYWIQILTPDTSGDSSSQPVSSMACVQSWWRWWSRWIHSLSCVLHYIYPWPGVPLLLLAAGLPPLPQLQPPLLELRRRPGRRPRLRCGSRGLHPGGVVYRCRMKGEVSPPSASKVASELHPKVRNHGEGPY